MSKETRRLDNHESTVKESEIDISQLVKERQLRLDILKIFHQSSSIKKLCEQALSLLKIYLKCDAIAIRLKEGEDYPYLVNNGFSDEFIKSENYLCCHDKNGNLLRDSYNCPLISGICGAVINAEVNQDKPFFTKEGSFWTNSTTNLLASTLLDGQGITMRNTCIQYGYESVALIPIKTPNEHIGLLQVNAKSRDFFTLDTIIFLEELGHIIGIAGDRVKAEEAVIDLARFPSENPSPVLRVAKNGTIIYANAPCKSSISKWTCDTGYRVPKFLQKLIFNVLSSNQGKEIEIEDNGRIFLFSIVPAVDAEYVNVYGLDITARKKSENALKHSGERYMLAQRAANIGSWDWDIVTGNLEWSETIEPMFGFARGKFGGTYDAFLNCVHPDDRQHVIDSVNACIHKGAEYNIEHRIVWPDNSVHWVSETGDVMRNENNKAIRMLGIVQDITARKKAEEILKRDKETFENLVNERTNELLKAQTELDRAKRLSDIGTLAATVAHELRNPLAAMLLATFNIKKKRQNELLDKHLVHIEKKILESNQIINNLLFYSRLRPPQYEPIFIYVLLSDCISSTQKRYKKKQVSIVKKIAAIKNINIKADPLQINEVFWNILNNAYDAIEDKNGKIKIHAKYDNESIVIDFNDNGIGIDDYNITRVHEPFFTTKSKGTGLGLTVAHQIVTLHNGCLDITSTKGKGTKVTVTLPIKRTL